MADARVIPFPVRQRAALPELERKRRLIEETLRFVDASIERVRSWLPNARGPVRSGVLAELVDLESARDRLAGQRRELAREENCRGV